MLTKKISLLLLTIITAVSSTMAQNNYETLWKKVEQLTEKGLTRSALKTVVSIYKQALKENNDAQQIKACIYQVELRSQVEEESAEKSIALVDSLIARSQSPSRNILQSMQAEMYYQYLENNRWKLYDRTKLKEEKSKDISTWSIDKLNAVIAKLYLASIDNRSEALLKKIPVEQYKPILTEGKNTRHLRPTLYDFLSFRALDYFMNDERDITKPAYKFSIEDSKAFAPAETFIHSTFNSSDSSSLHYQAILLLKKILSFHTADVKKDALLDADLIRLDFMHRYAVNEDKQQLYEAALKNIIGAFAELPASAQASFLLAKEYHAKGLEYNSTTKPEYQYELKRAKELCEAATKKFPGSEGGINAANLLHQILHPSLNMETEAVNTPLHPFRVLLTYRNVQKVFFRIVKIKRDALNDINKQPYDQKWPSIAALKPAKTWSVNLPDPLDYQSHAVETKIDALENGLYLLLASVDENFSTEKNILIKQECWISNIGVINNETLDYYLLHRDSGEPLAGASVQVWEKKYDYNNGIYTDTKAEQLIADENGHFNIKRKGDYRQINLQINYKGDDFFPSDIFEGNIYDSYSPPNEAPVTFFFTDRSIYRPGQTVYFKGIVIARDRNISKSKIKPGFTTTIQLKDANQQVIGSATVQTNEFGSFNGTFKLPEGQMNGEFSLFDVTTSVSSPFSVEEYKRPKFKVDIKKPGGSYRINDSVIVTGTAKAFAGNAVDGATVKYRVVRSSRLPIWWEWGGYKIGNRFPFSGEIMEIANGTTTTNNKGEFEVLFKAIPDKSISKSLQPTFTYEVSADITDINGETHSSSTSIAVAYQALQLNIDLDKKIQADSFKSLMVRCSNMNDVKEQSVVNVIIQQLKSPQKLFRERYWNEPDQFLMSRDEYYSYFPYDVYKNENQPSNYEVQSTAFQKNDSSNHAMQFGNINWTNGWYKIIATTKDKFGEEVKTEKYVYIEQSQQQGAITEPASVSIQKQTARPGENVRYSFFTGHDAIWLIQRQIRMEGTQKSTYHTIINNQPVTLNAEIKESDRGGVGINYVFVKHNRVYSGIEMIQVPWTNKELSISYSTFRDKLLPGEKEKWTIKISGEKGEKISAEMLAGMYDASLDQFRPHSWNNLVTWPMLSNYEGWRDNSFRSMNAEELNKIPYDYEQWYEKSYDRLLFSSGYNNGDLFMNARPTYREKGNRLDAMDYAVAAASPAERGGNIVVPIYDSLGSTLSGKISGLVAEISVTKKQQPQNEILVRKNLQETAFFFPELRTDSSGNISFSTIMPEALTQWKLMTFAHTKELASVYNEKTLVTQKPLMVQPNAPRFMREGDRMEFSAKIVNMSDTELTGTTTLELLDAASGKPVDGWFKNIFPNQYFTVAAGQSAAVKFPVEIPFNFSSALTYRIVAKAGNFSDGEEMALPVLTNRMLVTESMPLNVKGNSSKEFKFEKLISSGSSQSLSHQALTVEYSSNPAWYAVQALPYLMEYPYECAEQTFNRYYANALAAAVTHSMPAIKKVFEKWKNTDTAALLSNLQKNEELKSALLQETPWVLEAQSETRQKKNIGILFDMVRLGTEAGKALNKLKDMQAENGAFVWFKGGPDDRYITQYIVSGIGHLRKLGALNSMDAAQQQSLLSIAQKAIPYLDKKVKEDYEQLLKAKISLKKYSCGDYIIQYLYMRSMFDDIAVDATARKAYDFFLRQSKLNWLGNSKYMQAMTALVRYRAGDNKTAKAILASLKENAIMHEELGMYWKEWNRSGWFWHQAPIESQAMMIEAYTEIEKDTVTVDELKTWLLKQKQTSNWKSTRATAEACYALLLNGNNWLAANKQVRINIGNTVINSNEEAEAGTGYFKQKIEGKDIQPSMANIKVTVSSANNPMGSSTSWGAVYWQYFEDLDKITPAATPLSINKKLFIERNSANGPVLEPVTESSILRVGDKIKVRIELKVDRDMEYVHMKDMRASCMEPVNVISEYKYQGGLGYYESTKDASTNFFFSWLNRGTYVFEYPLFVTHTGNFSNGVTTIQCMYAPEFSSHSEGVRVTVE